MMTVLTIIATVVAVFAIQRAAVWFARQDFPDNDFLDGLVNHVYRVCDQLGWAIPEDEPPEVEGLDLYPSDGSNPFVPFITRIVVPSEYARQQVVRAIRYLHDSDIDTDYMAVNYLVHSYMGPDGEPSDHPPTIVVE